MNPSGGRDIILEGVRPYGGICTRLLLTARGENYLGSGVPAMKKVKFKYYLHFKVYDI